MYKTFLAPALIAQIYAMLPTIEFKPEWAGNTEYFEPLLAADPEEFVDREVHACTDNLGRRLFIARNGNTLNVVFERKVPTPDAPISSLIFQGNTVVAEAMGASSDCGTVGLEEVSGFFAYFGPETVFKLLYALVEHPESTGIVGAVAANDNGDVSNVVNEEQLLRMAQVQGQSAGRLARLHLLTERLAAAGPKRVQESVTIVRFDTPMKKAALIGGISTILGLAVYGGLRLAASR